MTPSTASSAVRRLEDALHTWQEPGGAFSPPELARLDADEAFPDSACRALNDAGLPACYVPARHGGKLTSFPEVAGMIRAVARRDLTVAIAHGATFLGAVSAWVAGTPDMAAQLAGHVLSGEAVCWGLTERRHGSDLLAGELTAEQVEDGWRLDGEKWLINNAARGRLACVLARTSAAGGPRGFSLFLIDKNDVTSGRVQHLDKIRTLGIRGAHISGLSLDQVHVPHSALIGEAGKGAEIVLKALQLTRTTCVTLSLGAADHALALALRSSRERTPYGRAPAGTPLTHDALGRAGAQLLVAEAVAALATRAIHVLPGEMSVLSAVCKAFVPTVIEKSIHTVGELLGARGFLTDQFAHGAFARLERDHRIVGLFDGTTHVNRQLLINQFARLGRAYGSADPSAAEKLQDLMAGPLPEFSPDRLLLTSPTGCSPALAIPGLLRHFRGLDTTGSELATLLDEFGTAAADLHAGLAAYRPTPGIPDAEAFQLAERYEWCVAGAACLLFLAERHDDRSRDVLHACLELVMENLAPDRHHRDEVFAALAPHLSQEDQPITLFGQEPGGRP